MAEKGDRTSSRSRKGQPKVQDTVDEPGRTEHITVGDLQTEIAKGPSKQPEVEQETMMMSLFQQMMQKLDENKEEIKADVSKKLDENREEMALQLEQNKVEMADKLDDCRKEWQAENDSIKKELVHILEVVQKKFETQEERILNLTDQKIIEIKENFEKENTETREEVRGVYEHVKNLENRTDIRFGDVKIHLRDEKKAREDQFKHLNEKLNEEMQRTVVPGVPFQCQHEEALVKFSGDVHRVHPKVFLKQIVNYMKKFRNFEEAKETVRRNLTQKAALWFASIENDIDTVEIFENKFLQYFWGDSVQSNYRELLQAGKFVPNKGESLNEYALRIYSVAQYLEPRPLESEIVLYLSRHYDPKIAEVISIQNIKTIEQLCAYLMRIDRAHLERFTERKGWHSNDEYVPCKNAQFNNDQFANKNRFQNNRFNNKNNRYNNNRYNNGYRNQNNYNPRDNSYNNRNNFYNNQSSSNNNFNRNYDNFNNNNSQNRRPNYNNNNNDGNKNGSNFGNFNNSNRHNGQNKSFNNVSFERNEQGQNRPINSVTFENQDQNNSRNGNGWCYEQRTGESTTGMRIAPGIMNPDENIEVVQVHRADSMPINNQNF